MWNSWAAQSIKNIKTRASWEMTSRNNIKSFDFSYFFNYLNPPTMIMGWTLPSTGMWRGEIFAISDFLVVCMLCCLIITSLGNGGRMRLVGLLGNPLLPHQRHVPRPEKWKPFEYRSGSDDPVTGQWCCIMPLLCTLFRLNWVQKNEGLNELTKVLLNFS